MADKSIDQLNEAERIYATDLFVLQQSGSAKKLTGQVLLNWLTAAADGHGGIQSISKLSTSGLSDTYRITLADTTVFDFVVNNGRGIIGISKTSTSGLVDTYTISYNDGTSGTLTVTNGEKGDKGDNAYIWIKYASQEPTESSHSIGDIPDNWMGIYSGNASTAPTDWKQYKWFKHKGEQGDTGDSAVITGAKVEYQVSDSGTVTPSGTWRDSVPVVAQGKYLWTKTTIEFNTGSPVISYGVSRMGVDGAGSVSSVNGVSPGSDGNVVLSATDVSALPVEGGGMDGDIRMNGNRLTGLPSPTNDSDPLIKASVLDIIYPVGAIYISASTTSPASLLGGTWERIKDRFLLAAGDTYIAGNIGGEAAHTLTIDEMPSHGHKSLYAYDSGAQNFGFSWVAKGNVSSSDKITSSGIDHTGGGKAHNNMPPYLAVYVWKRVA